MTKAEVEQLQKDLSRFTNRFLEKFPEITVQTLANGDRVLVVGNKRAVLKPLLEAGLLVELRDPVG